MELAHKRVHKTSFELEVKHLKAQETPSEDIVYRVRVFKLVSSVTPLVASTRHGPTTDQGISG